MCFKGNCDVTNEAERLSTLRTSKRGVGEGGGGGGGGGDGEVAWRWHL